VLVTAGIATGLGTTAFGRPASPHLKNGSTLDNAAALANHAFDICNIADHLVHK
jgi:hypothetical protein